MTRASAIRKVRALRRLAERPGTEAEGVAAEDRAERLIERFELAETEIAPEPARQPPRSPIVPVPFGGFATATFTSTGTAGFANTTQFVMHFRVG